MNSFKVFKIYEHEGSVQGRVETAQLDELDPGEVVIRAQYSSVNYKDALAATGAGTIIRRFPRIGGIDVAGKVVSSTDPRFSPGAAVLVTGYGLGVDHDGGYAETVRVPAEWVVPIPGGISVYEAMAIGTAGFTAALCIQRMEDNGQRPAHGPVAVTGASGGVGCLAIDLLSGLGYEVTAITGKDAEHDYLRELGAAQVMDRKALDYGTQPLLQGIWAGAIDTVGGNMLAWLTRTTKLWGNIAAVGLAGGSQLHTTVMPFILRGVSLLGVSSSGCPTGLRHRTWQRLATDLRPQRLDKIVAGVVSLEELPGVFDTLLKGQGKGRTLVAIG